MSDLISVNEAFCFKLREAVVDDVGQSPSLEGDIVRLLMITIIST